MKIGKVTFLVIALVVVSSFGINQSVMAEDADLMGHIVHEDVLTGTGGNVEELIIEEIDGVEEINFETYSSIPNIHERLFRESSLPSTDLDVAYLLNTEAIPRIFHLLEPLDGYLSETSISNFPDAFSEGMLEALTYEDKLYGIPVRSATNTLHYNEKWFEEKGLDGPPETPDEFYEYAKELTFKNDNGDQVYGFAVLNDYYTQTLALARMWDGDIITEDYEVVCDEPEMVKAVEMLAKMYEKGIMPSDISTIDHAEFNRRAQSGNYGMLVSVGSQTEIFNDPENSEVAGSWKVAAMPVSEEISDKYDIGPSCTEFWSLVIPASAKDKETAWEIINLLSSHDVAYKMARNGNDPARLSVYEDSQYLNEVEYADILKETTKITRVAIPAFDKYPEGVDIIKDYLEQAILGKMEAQEAMDELAAELTGLSDQLK